MWNQIHIPIINCLNPYFSLFNLLKDLIIIKLNKVVINVEFSDDTDSFNHTFISVLLYFYSIFSTTKLFLISFEFQIICKYVIMINLEKCII